MRPFKFIHCADLHLGTPFRGLSELNPDLGEALNKSTYTAFDNIVQLAIEEKVDCVLIAGDVYDSEDSSLKAQMKFRDNLARLSEEGIWAFVTHGNHDPISGWAAKLELPERVSVFPGDKVTSIPFQDNDETVAMIYGISFPKREIHDNLSLQFTSGKEKVPHIGVLHTMVGASTVHDSYAPCNTKDLTGSGMDYWALGHVHQGGVLRPSGPAIVYSGCSQSRSPRETGEKGCYLVSIEFGSDPDIKFVSTDVIRYVSDAIDIAALPTLDQVADSIIRKCMDISGESDERSVIARLSLKGRTDLHSQLKRTNSIPEILENVREQLAAKEPFVWLESLRLETAGTYDLDSLKKGDNFTADIIAVFDNLEAPESEDWEKLRELFQPLFNTWGGNRLLDQLSDEKLIELARNAKENILNLLTEES